MANNNGLQYNNPCCLLSSQAKHRSRVSKKAFYGIASWDDKETVKQRKKFAKDFSNITSIDKRRAN